MLTTSQESAAAVADLIERHVPRVRCLPRVNIDALRREGFRIEVAPPTSVARCAKYTAGASLPASVRDAIIAGVARGALYREIAAEFGVSVSVVSHVVRLAGVRRKVGRPERSARAGVDTEDLR